MSKKTTTEKRTKATPYRLSWNCYGTLEDYTIKLEGLVHSPLGTMRECDGDIWVSEFTKLMEAWALIQNKDD